MSQHLHTFGVERSVACTALACRLPRKQRPFSPQAWCQRDHQQPDRQCLSARSKHRKPNLKCAAWGWNRTKSPKPWQKDGGKDKSSKDSSPPSEAESKKFGNDSPKSAARAEVEDINSIGDQVVSSSQAKLSSLQPDKHKQKHSRGAAWEDWEDWDPDWEGPPSEPLPPDQFRKDNPRRGMGSKTPRDEYLRPMIDTLGIRYRLGFKRMEAEEAVQTEYVTNQWESREAVKFAAILVIIPVLTGWILGAIVFEPTITIIHRINPHAFEISEKQKLEGAKEVHKAEMRMRMDAAIGRAPPLRYDELQAQLRIEAHELLEEFEEKNQHNVLTAVSDSLTGLTGFGILLRDTEGRGILFRTLGRIFGGLSDTAKAFLIIAVTDIFLGFHSEEGWTAVLHLLANHYGAEVEEAPLYTFVAIVPVTMDALFKYWIWKGLNRRNPAAAATLKQMDRH